MTTLVQHTRPPIDRASRIYFVYWVLGGDGSSLYIGITKNPDQRWQNHRHLKPQMVALACRFRLRGPYVRATALAIEKAAIRAEDPPFNFEVPRAQQSIKRERIAALMNEASA